MVYFAIYLQKTEIQDAKDGLLVYPATDKNPKHHQNTKSTEKQFVWTFQPPNLKWIIADITYTLGENGVKHIIVILLFNNTCVI